MASEKLENKLIKGLWSLTGLKSSDFIRMVKARYPELTGSRLRGLMSGVGNDNYRPATIDDVVQCLNVVAAWAGCAEFDRGALILNGEMVANLLRDVDAEKAAGIDIDAKEKVKNVFKKNN